MPVCRVAHSGHHQCRNDRGFDGVSGLHAPARHSTGLQAAFHAESEQVYRIRAFRPSEGRFFDAGFRVVQPPPASGIGVGRMGSALDGWVMHAPDAPPPNPNRTDACEAHPKPAIGGWRGDGNGGWNGKRARDREPAGIDSRQPRPPFPACFQVTHPKIFLSWLFSGSRCRVPVMSFTIVPPHSGIAVRIDTRTHAASATTDRSKRSLTAGFIPERT